MDVGGDMVQVMTGYMDWNGDGIRSRQIEIAVPYQDASLAQETQELLERNFKSSMIGGIE